MSSKETINWTHPGDKSCSAGACSEFARLPRRDCSVPSSVDAMSLSLSSPRPLSFHDCAVFSNTYNLHCIWGGRWRVATLSSFRNACVTQQCTSVRACESVCVSLQGPCRLPVKHCSLLPLQSWRWPSLRCTSWLWLWCRLLQTLPKTRTQCSLPGFQSHGTVWVDEKGRVAPPPPRTCCNKEVGTSKQTLKCGCDTAGLTGYQFSGSRETLSQGS